MTDELIDEERLARYTRFGQEVYAWMLDGGEDFFAWESSDEWAELAEKHGLAERVNYDPLQHGDDIEADPGTEIWIWTP